MEPICTCSHSWDDHRILDNGHEAECLIENCGCNQFEESIRPESANTTQQ
jgi:hypothetical protein